MPLIKQYKTTTALATAILTSIYSPSAVVGVYPEEHSFLGFGSGRATIGTNHRFCQPPP
ncbi:MAG: hypothetical protein U9O98_10305 [Asgard group archaeon]|nr:hypothetical protein [Asgard group archaeon]